MNQDMEKQTKSYTRKRQQKKHWRRFAAFLGACAVFFTTYALILPAITWERSLLCGQEEHTHGEACYEPVTVAAEKELQCELEEHEHGEDCYELTLICQEEESAGHVHGEECYGTVRTLVCPLEESVGHVHGEECHGTVRTLVCPLEESEGHTHSEACLGTGLICGKEESEGHTHGGGCFDEEGTLVCPLEESEGHVHTEECRGSVLLCGLEESEGHVHGDGCYEETEGLICGLEESEGHVHGDGCYEETEGLICGLEEGEGHVHTEACYEKTLVCTKAVHTHTEECYTETAEEQTEMVLICEIEEHTHTDACFDAPPAEDDGYYCGKIEHTHSEEQYCFFSDGSLRCTIPEHQHTLACKSNPKADVETAAEWEKTFANGELPEKPKLNDTAIEKRTVESEPASDGAVAVVTGKLPGGAVVEIEAVELSEEQMVRYFGEEKAAAMSGYVAYDITIFADDEEWQPDESVSVVIRHPDIRVSGEGNLSLAHVDSMTQEVSEVEPTLYDNGDIEFTAEGFSLFIAYTVDFHYNELTFSIAGESEILLSELFERLGIEKSVSEIEYVDFSDGNLLRIEQQGEDWLLVSLAPFSTTEQLTLFCADGSIIPIAVTDARIGENDYVLFYLDIDSAIPTIQQFEYTITYAGLDFTYDINTKQTATLTSQVPGVVNKTLTIAAGSRIPIYVLNGTNYIKVRETPIEGVHTYVQLGGNPMEERYDAMVGNENTPSIFTWAYGNAEAICYKHMNEESTGQLTIKKEVTGNAPAGQTYQFSVVRHNGTYKWVEEIVTLQAGQTSDPIPYTHTTEYEASPQIWIAELDAPSDATASYSVNGVSATARNRELHWRFEQDVCNYNQTKLKSYQNCKWVVLDTDSNQPDISAVCTNVFPDTNSLTVSKAVSGVTDNATEFQFELTAKTAASPYTPINFTGKPLPSGVKLKQGTSTVLTFKLKNGKSIEFSNLIPNGSLVTLTETSHKNYNVSMAKSGDTQSGDTWQFLLDRDSTVAVTNSAVPVGDIAVKKTVTGGTSSDAFPMQLTIADTSGKIDFTDAAFYGRATIPSGVTRTAVSKDSVTFAFSLAHDEEIVIGDLVPDGARVTISETGSGNYEPSIAVNGASLDGATRTFSVSGTGTTDIEVKNKLIMLASLTVTKQVSGVHTAQAFPFELQVLNSDDTVPDFTEQQSSLPAGVALKDGTTNVFCFDLADGEHVDLIDILPLNGKLTLTETGNAGYSVTMDTEQMHYSGGSNTFTIGKDTTVCVTNTAGTLLPETGGIGVYPIYALGILLIAGSVMYGHILRRKRAGKAE